MVGSDVSGAPVELHAVDWYTRGLTAGPSWVFKLPGVSCRECDPELRVDFTSWRLVMVAPGGVTELTKAFDPIPLWPGDSLTLNYSVDSWDASTVGAVRRHDDD